MNSKVNCFPFVPYASDKPPFQIIDIKGFLKQFYSGGYQSQQANVIHEGIYKQSGWCYNLKPFLKRFIVKFEYDSRKWEEFYAPSKAKLKTYLSSFTESSFIDIRELT